MINPIEEDRYDNNCFESKKQENSSTLLYPFPNTSECAQEHDNSNELVFEVIRFSCKEKRENSEIESESTTLPETNEIYLDNNYWKNRLEFSDDILKNL